VGSTCLGNKENPLATGPRRLAEARGRLPVMADLDGRAFLAVAHGIPL
jgi:hypothetical protein